MKLEEVTSVRWLKANHYQAHYFGLGFIQIKLDLTTRIHVYHPDVPAFVEEPHDHRYDFISSVLSGGLKNTVWMLGDSGWDVNVEFESCTAGEKEVPAGSMGKAYVLGDFLTYQGSGYHMNADTFHTVSPDFTYGPCVTMIRRSLPHKEFARILRLPGSPAVCPFSKPMGQDTLWGIVAECLAD